MSESAYGKKLESSKSQADFEQELFSQATKQLIEKKRRIQSENGQSPLNIYQLEIDLLLSLMIYIETPRGIMTTRVQ